jgi:sugar phosphate isomerase/epimerase
MAVGSACLLPRTALGWAGQSGGIPITGPRKGERAAPFAFGVASYTFRSFSRAQVIAFMKELRLTDLNAKDVKDHLPSTSAEAEMQAIADYKAAGIKLTAAGNIGFPKDDDEDVRAKFEYCKRADIKIIVCDPEIAVLPTLERFVKQYDMRLAIHNHGPEHKVFHSPLDVLEAVKNMDPRMGCCVDVGHTMRAGVDPVAAIRAVGPRLYDVHVKDLAKPDSRESQVNVGEGLMPFREIFQALMDLKYAGHVDLEYEIHGDNPMPGVIESFAYMRGMLAGMGLRA